MTSSDNNDIVHATSALSSDGPTFYRRGTRDRKESNRDYHRKESFENSKHMRYHTSHDFLLFLTWSIKNRERTETKETKNEIHHFSRVIFRITIISKFPLILRRKSENSFHSPFSSSSTHYNPNSILYRLSLEWTGSSKHIRDHFPPFVSPIVVSSTKKQSTK